MKLTHCLSKLALGIALCFWAITAAAQTTPSPAGGNDVLLTVGGEVAQPLRLTRADLDKFARQSVRAKDHDGKEYKFDGVSLLEILQKAGLKFGDALRGKALATYLLVEAADGYQAVFALPEFDPPSTDRMIVLADHQSDNPFPSGVGPLKIIVPGDKTHARWVRQVKSLTVVRAPVATTARP